MKFHTFGDEDLPCILMIHGGGNAWWNYLRQARALSLRYHVVLPTLDGHGEEFATPYVSTEKTADQILDHIDRRCSGHLFALCGVSLGGQIVYDSLPSEIQHPEHPGRSHVLIWQKGNKVRHPVGAAVPAHGPVLYHPGGQGIWPRVFVGVSAGRAAPDSTSISGKDWINALQNAQ